MEYIKLSTIASINAGGTPNRSKKEYWNGDIPWLKISDIKGKFINSSTEFITENGLNNSSAKYFEIGTILYTIFATVGETAILTFRSTTNQAIAGIRLESNEYLVEYIYHYLKSIKNKVRFDSKGVAQNNINLTYLKNLNVPVASCAEQQKIVFNLNKIVDLVGKFKTILSNLDNLVKSQFIEMFGKLEDTEYPIDTLNNICEFIKDGTHQTPTYTEDEDGYIFVSSKDVTSGKIDWDNTKKIPKELHDQLYSRIAPKKNDILLSKNGTIGFAVLVEEDRIFDIYVSLAILRQNKLNPVFMKEQLNAEDCQKQFYSSLKGIGVPNLHLGEIKKTKVIVPPIELQNKFADFVQQIDKSKFILQKQIDLLNELLEKKMNEYFGN